MKQALLRSVAAFVLLTLVSLMAFAQVSSTGSINGAITDQAGAVVPNATVVIRNNATREEFTAQTTDNGTFNAPSLGTGTYTVTITAPSFKQTVVQNVKIDVGKPSTLNVALEVGGVTETVTITGGGGELINSANANVATTITGRQITDLPYASRNALDVVLFLPGTSTVGRPRQSSVNGLPKGSLNITLDGVNIQDNLLKSNDGFFTYIQPKTDAVEEVTLSTATPGAESSGEGAVQIKFATRSGTNEYHGSGYVYLRNSFFNANYFFNNRDLPEDPVDHKAPRTRVFLTQPGVRFGGPISIPKLFNGRDRAFFFVNYEEYRLPERQLRQRTIYTPKSETGIFTFIPTSGPKAGQPQTVNLLQLAAGANCGTTAAPVPCTSTIDPTVGSLLTAIRQSTSKGGLTPLTDPNFQQFSFINSGAQKRYFPTVRFDFNLTKKEHLENIWNYQKFTSVVDFLNNTDPQYPGFPNFGSQASNRFSNTTALRSTLTSNLINEARFGLTGGTVVFFPEISPAEFANQGGFSLNLPNGGISSATASRTPQRRNSPVKQFTDTLTYVRGNHSYNFGGSFTQINLFSQFPSGGIVPLVGFGVDSTDPASSIFKSTNPAFAGASTTQITQAQNIYALLTGRVTSVSGVAVLDEESNQYSFLGSKIERARQREFGLFAQDTWRIRPNVTLTGGLRYEVQYPYIALNKVYSETTFAGLFGVSGLGNINKPGTLTGSVTQFTQVQPGQHVFNTDRNNFAPSFGISYSPDWKSGLLNRFFGNSGQTVLRAGYSIAFNREGVNTLSSILGSNPGGTTNAARSIALGNLTGGTLLRNLIPYSPPAFPAAPVYPLTGAATDSVNVFNPKLKLGYVQSWTVGIQREITKNMVFEARYVGNRGTKLWRQYDINEYNVLENGFINEFRQAQANLAANNASGMASRAGSFAFFGSGTGTAALPTFVALLAGTADPNLPASYSAANFTNATFVNPLSPNNADPQGLARTLFAGSAARRANFAAAGKAPNFFVVNPNYLGGAFVVDNGGHTWYDAMTLELRRRLSAGLLVQANYTFAKAETNMYASSSAVFAQYPTIRDPKLAKTLAPFDIRHAFKANFVYDLPFGKGKSFLSDVSGLVDKLVGGFSVNGTLRVQSGSPFNLGNVQLVNMTRKELQKFIEIRKDPNRIVYFLDQSVIDNTIRAFNTNPNSPTGYSATFGPPTPGSKYIAPASSNGCLQAYAGQCGFSNLVLHGPRFTRIDLSVVKRLKFTENTNLEFRTEFLNAINNINFKVGNYNSDVVYTNSPPQVGTLGGINGTAAQTFGQTTFAYQDVSTTNDPGGRLIQFVLRLNF